jgi:hypothetical protein
MTARIFATFSDITEILLKIQGYIENVKITTQEFVNHENFSNR